MRVLFKKAAHQKFFISIRVFEPSAAQRERDISSCKIYTLIFAPSDIEGFYRLPR